MATARSLQLRGRTALRAGSSPASPTERRQYTIQYVACASSRKERVMKGIRARDLSSNQQRLIAEVTAVQTLTKDFMYKKGSVLVKDELEVSVTVEDFSAYYILGRLSALCSQLEFKQKNRGVDSGDVGDFLKEHPFFKECEWLRNLLAHGNVTVSDGCVHAVDMRSNKKEEHILSREEMLLWQEKLTSVLNMPMTVITEHPSGLVVLKELGPKELEAQILNKREIKRIRAEKK